MRDFNSYTGTSSEITELDDNLMDIGGIDITTKKSLEVLNNIRNIKRVNNDRIKKDVYGEKLLEVCRNAGLCFLNGRYESDGLKGKATTTLGTVIDYMIVNPGTLQNIAEFIIGDFDPLLSDIHCKLTLNLTIPSVTDDPRKKEKTSEEFQVKWIDDKKQEYVDNLDIGKINNLCDNLQMNNIGIQSVTNELCDLMLSCAKVTFGRSKRKKPIKHPIPNFSRSCQEAKREYYNARTKQRIEKTHESYQNLISKSKLYRRAIKQHKNQVTIEFNNKLRTLKTSNPRMYWNILNKKSKTEQVEAPAEQLYDHFKRLAEGTEEYMDAKDTTGIDPPQEMDTEALNAAITEEEIRKNVKSMKNRKAGGPDDIVNEYIKYGLDKLLPVYLIFFNKVLETSEIPEDWVIGEIIPLYKGKGNIKVPVNYRGITLLSCLGKLFTSIINRRLTIFIETNSLLSENQTGFRKGYSTIDHCFLLNCIVDIFKKSSKKLYCAFVDYRQAFDKIWRNGLWYKIINMGISGKVLSVIMNLYKNIKSCVLVNKIKSNCFMSKVGVRQGENLSPLLFSIFVNDLENFMIQRGNSSLKFDYELCNTYLKILVLMYADDTVIMSNTCKGLQSALSSLEQYCKIWKLEVNSDKTKVCVFSSRKVKKGVIKIMYDGQLLEVVDSFKYLCLSFNFNGKFHLCKKHIVSQASRAMFSVLSKGRKHNLSTDTMLDLFDKMIVPILTYGSEIWAYEESKVIEMLHLKFCKYILS